MTDSIVIIDSSDDETSAVLPPTKKMKLEVINGRINDEKSCGLKITEVTSLANRNTDSEVIEIDDDDTPIEKLCITESSTTVSVETASPIIVEPEAKEIVPAATTTNLSCEFQEFIETCISCSENIKHRTVMESKVPNIKERYNAADPSYVKSKNFLKLVQTAIAQIKLKPINAIVHFRNVYEELKSRKKIDDNVDLSEKQSIFLTRLNKTLRLLNRKIKKLEEKEVDWDDDNDSHYMQMQSYRRKFVDVHKKICSYTKENQYSGRIIHRKLDFSASKYSDINRALDKLYLKHKKFPLFDEVNVCIRKCVKEKDLKIGEHELETEIHKMFVEMGKLVQMRRKHELEVMNNDFLGTSDDPALQNAQLQATLEEQSKLGAQKMEAIFEAFSNRQAQGDDPVVSSDTDSIELQEENLDT